MVILWDVYISANMATSHIYLVLCAFMQFLKFSIENLFEYLNTDTYFFTRVQIETLVEFDMQLELQQDAEFDMCNTKTHINTLNLLKFDKVLNRDLT